MTSRGLRWVALALVAVALAATYFAIMLARSAATRVVAEVPEVLGRVGDFELADRSGATVRLGDLTGEPWVADFIFTRCALSCPRLTSVMVRLGVDAPGVRRVSFTVDPEHDTPAVLADYAQAYGVTDADWLFLTGPRDAVETLVRDDFKLPIVREPPPELASEEEPILHSNRFVLIDASDAIRGYYLVTEQGEYERLLADLAALRDEPTVTTAPEAARAESAVVSNRACLREIEELHAFLEGWFGGSLPASDEAFSRFADVLAEEFVIIGPGGLELDRAAILDDVRGEHGSRADFSIRIEKARVRGCHADWCVATYEEWQRSGEESRGRVSTILFGARPGTPNGVEWRHLHETWVPDVATVE